MIIIDRIEGKFAVCEMPDGSMCDIPLRQLPKGAKPGHVLRLMQGKYQLDETQTVDRLARIRELERKLFGDAQG